MGPPKLRVQRFLVRLDLRHENDLSGKLEMSGSGSTALKALRHYTFS